MKNRTLLDIKVPLTTLEEAEEAVQANGKLVETLFRKEEKKGGCSARLFLFVMLILSNIGLYHLLKRVSPGYMVPKMILGNILAIILLFAVIILIANILFRKRKEEADQEYIEDDKYVITEEVTEENFHLFNKPRLTLREHDFTYGGGSYDWTEIRDYVNADDWLFIMLNDDALVPIKIDNLKEKRRMEVLGIFSDRIRKAKTTQQSDDEQ